MRNDGNYADRIINLVYPRRCPVCDEPVSAADNLICEECRPKLRYIEGVENVVKNLNAAFVCIAPGQNCYLPLQELKNPVFTKKQSDKGSIQIFYNIFYPAYINISKHRCPGQGFRGHFDQFLSGITECRNAVFFFFDFCCCNNKTVHITRSLPPFSQGK